MQGKDGEIASRRWFDQDCQWTMFEKLRAALEGVLNATNIDKGGGMFICAEAMPEVNAAFALLEDLSIQENLRKREFLDVMMYEAIAAMRENGAAVCVFTPSELRGARVSRVEDRLVEFGWECIDSLAAFPHTVACEHCGNEFESAEADYDETLDGVAIICPHCAGYNVKKEV